MQFGDFLVNTEVSKLGTWDVFSEKDKITDTKTKLFQARCVSCKLPVGQSVRLSICLLIKALSAVQLDVFYDNGYQSDFFMLFCKVIVNFTIPVNVIQLSEKGKLLVKKP